jgi:hypothetical protein
MRVSKFIKVHKDILLEYIYDDGNLIGEPYETLVNIKDHSYSYVAGVSSGTINTRSNQLFKIDGINNRYGKVDVNQYPFLQVKEFGGGFPIRHDTIKIHLPINYTFGEYSGFYIKVFSFDSPNTKTYDLSNFFFDLTDPGTTAIIGYSSPPLNFQEKLWGKNIQLTIPSVYSIANQRENNNTKPNTINYNLTNGIGLNLNSPIFIDFQFITKKETINNITTYLLTSKLSTSIPQTPEFEKLGVKIEESINGDFFEIYGTFNNTIGEFKRFIDNAVSLGNRYYVQYTITMYEQNIRGKSIVMTVIDNFNEKVEFRPIIKFSTTTAIIDVEMKLIDSVDDSQILRRASFGMLQDQVSKYSLSMLKINLKNAHKPKIYNIKSPIGAGIFGRGDNLSLGSGSGFGNGGSSVILEPVKVPFPVLIDKFNVVAKSDNVKVNKDTFYGLGKLQIVIYPFDNIVKFIIASDIDNSQVLSPSGTIGTVTAPRYMDLTNMGGIKMIIKNQQLSEEFNLYMESGEVNLELGVVIFKIPTSKINNLRKISDSGINVFYITTSQENTTSVIYSGLYKIYDSISNISDLNVISNQVTSLNNTPSIITDPNAKAKEKAIVTRVVYGTNNFSYGQNNFGYGTNNFNK